MNGKEIWDKLTTEKYPLKYVISWKIDGSLFKENMTQNINIMCFVQLWNIDFKKNLKRRETI